MSNKTIIHGKDLPAEDTICNFKKMLQSLNFSIEEISCRNPIPGVWSVTIRDAECYELLTNGKGTSKQAALASAYGEFVERLSTMFFFTDFYVGNYPEYVYYPMERWFLSTAQGFPEGLLNKELWEFYNPSAELHCDMLTDANASVTSRGVCAFPFTRVSDKETVWFPVNILNNIYVSNGMAAGNTECEARSQALCEIVERFVKKNVIVGEICLPDIPEQALDGYSILVRARESFKQIGCTLLVKDASLGGEFPVVCVALVKKNSGGCTVSFGAHPQFSIALERAVTELLQGREIDSFNDCKMPLVVGNDVSTSANMEDHFVNSTGAVSWSFFRNVPDYEYVAWNYEGSTENEFQHLCEIVYMAGHNVYVADYDRAGAYACRIVVPGMSEIYDVDDLVWSNKYSGAFLHERIVRIFELEPAQQADLYSILDSVELGDQFLVANLIGLAAQPESIWSSLTIGELKAMIALSLGWFTEAKEWVHWCVMMGEFIGGRSRLYECLNVMLSYNADRDAYISGLRLFFDADVVEICEDILLGEERYYGLTPLGADFSQCAHHKKIIDAFKKVRGRL